MSFFLWTLGPAFLLALGNILQKVGLAHIAEHRKPEGRWAWTVQVLGNLPWWGGMVISAVATILYYGALGRYNMSLVQPMMALNPVLTALIGWAYLKEELEGRTLAAIALIVLGLACAGTLGSEAGGSEQPLQLWSFSLFWIFVIMIARIFVLHFEARKALIGGVGFGLSALFIKSLTHRFESLGGLDWIQAGFPFDHRLATILGDVGFELRLWCFVASYLAGFFYTQASMTRGRALFVVPFSAALGMLIPTLAGLIVFQEPAGGAKIAAVSLVALGSALFIRLREDAPASELD